MNMQTQGAFRRKNGNGGENEGNEVDLKALGKELKIATDEVKRFAEQAEKRLKDGENLSQEAKTEADKALLKMNSIDEKLTQIEQKLARGGRSENDPEVKSYGKQVSEDAGVKSLRERSVNAARIQLKAITAAQGAAWSDRDLTPTALPMRDLKVRDLLTVMQTEAGSVDYARQTTRTNNAAAVAEGAQKPTSNYIWAQATAPVRTIAHLAKLTRQALDDVKQLEGEVEMEMRYGLALAEDAELLNGDGTGQNLLGLIPQATAYVAPYAAPAPVTIIDQMRLAFLQATLADYRADGAVLHPIDWDRIIGTKTTEGVYIFANPVGIEGPILWGRRIVDTTSMSVDKFLVGAFKVAGTIYDRMAPEVLISSENADDFEKNLLTMRCEERLGLGVKRPAALIYGDFGNVA